MIKISLQENNGFPLRKEIWSSKKIYFYPQDMHKMKVYLRSTSSLPQLELQDNVSVKTPWFTFLCSHISLFLHFAKPIQIWAQIIFYFVFSKRLIMRKIQIEFGIQGSKSYQFFQQLELDLGKNFPTFQLYFSCPFFWRPVDHVDFPDQRDERLTNIKKLVVIFFDLWQWPRWILFRHFFSALELTKTLYMYRVTIQY